MTDETTIAGLRKRVAEAETDRDGIVDAMRKVARSFGVDDAWDNCPSEMMVEVAAKSQRDALIEAAAGAVMMANDLSKTATECWEAPE